MRYDWAVIRNTRAGDSGCVIGPFSTYEDAELFVASTTRDKMHQLIVPLIDPAAPALRKMAG